MSSSVDFDIPIMSYNSTGWSEFKADFVNTLLLTHSIQIFALQEHFKLSDNVHKLDCFLNYDVFTVPAYKHSNSLHSGRPSGGISLIYSHSISQYVSRINCPESHRVQGLKFSPPGASFLFINAYFPVDTGNNNFDEGDLVRTLQDIKYLIDQAGEGCSIVLMGDLNSDLARDTPYVRIVRNFLHENNLISLWTKFECEFTYYHERVTRGRTIVSKSKIDHFCVNSDSINSCSHAMPLHFGENTSNHSPIYMRLSCNVTPMQSSSSNESAIKQSKPQWFKSTDAQKDLYVSDLNALLHNINVDTNVITCRNPHCTVDGHREHLEDLSTFLLDSISEAVASNIPHSGVNQNTVIPGWTEFVAPYKKDSVFWRAVWVSAGRPLDTQLHSVMKHTRTKYHHAIKKVRRHEAELRRSKFLDACLNNEVSDILKDIKKDRTKNTRQSTVIDGHNSSDKISDHFKTVYTNIYNTHKDSGELNDFSRENSENISQSDVDLVESITPDLVKKLISKLSNNKNDSSFDWKSDALKVGVDALAVPICDLLRAMLIHGFIPKILLVCQLIPIVKNTKESKLSSSNYRLIAISSLLLKLLDHLILELSCHELKPSPHQMGFQRGLSTNMCTWSLVETINIFRNQGGPVFLCLMDLTKAFDLVKFNILFRKLSNKVAPILLRLLIFSYVHQECSVNWNGSKSSKFKISNGVRQGAVLSPTLFNLYIDSLFDRLRESGCGCWIKDLFFGAWGYADDIGLLAPSRDALQRMVNTCQKFFTEHGIQISVNTDISKTKTKIIAFGVDVTECLPVCLGSRPLPFVQQWEHLGVLISSDESLHHDLNLKKGAFIGKVHGLRQELGSQDPSVFIKLVQIYMLHLYGSSLWDIFDDTSITLWTEWHKLLKFSFNLPLPTHRYLLTDLVACEHPKNLIIKRFIKFSCKLAHSDNVYIRTLHNLQKADPRSIYGRNIGGICRLFGVTNLDQVDVSSSSMSSIPVNPVPVGEEWRVSMMHDLLHERNSNSGFITDEQIYIMLHHICCN